jgi:hypothetical protein
VPPPPPFGWSPSPATFHCAGADKRNRSRDAIASEFCCTTLQGSSPPRGQAKRRKAHANHLPRSINKRCRLLIPRARLRAIVGGAPAFRRFDRGSRRDSHPCSTPGHASWTWNQAGVTRPIPSQSSDSTSRLGRSTEGNDARSRSGADCEPARKHRTRSTLQTASGMRPSMSEIFPM